MKALPLVLLFLAGPCWAESPADIVSHCLDPARAEAVECTEIRASFLAGLRDCTSAAPQSAAGGMRSSHGYRARYQVCAIEVKARLRAAQN